MGFRFFRRIRVAPGITVNLSKRGFSTSVGPRGGKVTVGTRGTRATVGLPGTGLFYTDHRGWGGSGKRRAASKRDTPPPDPVAPEQKLNMGFLQRLLTPKGEQAFVEGIKAAHSGNLPKGLELLSGASHLADAAFFAGFLALKLGQPARAVQLLQQALQQSDGLGKMFNKYGLALNMAMRITDELTAYIGPTRRGALLGLVEAHQELRNYAEAIQALRWLRQSAPHDVVVKVSLAELLLESAPNSTKVCRDIVVMAGAVQNESQAHAALMLYKARALRNLGMHTAARDTLSAALRRKKDRSPALLRALRFERALAYEALNQAKRARAEYERLYAEDPNDKEVLKKLAL